MSRTIRRKNYVPKWATQTVLAVPTGRFARYQSWNSETKQWDVLVSPYETRQYIRVPLEGKALAKSLAKYHGDHGHGSAHTDGPHKDFRRNEQRKYRSHAKNEIHKYLRDDEYECMILANPKLPYWD